MDLKKALAKLEGLELDGKDELISAIKAGVEALQSKNFDVIGEKRTATQKVTSLEQALKAIAKAVGIEGEMEAILSETEAKVREIATKAQTLEQEKTALETRATTAEGKVKGFERDAQFTAIATVAGANLEVLKRLLGDRFDELKLEGEGDQRVVKLGDKPLKEAIAADEALKPFEAVLFPDTTKPSKSGGKLPSGSPNSGDNSSENPLAGYIGKTYVVPGQKQSAS